MSLEYYSKSTRVIGGDGKLKAMRGFTANPGSCDDFPLKRVIGARNWAKRNMLILADKDLHINQLGLTIEERAKIEDAIGSIRSILFKWDQSTEEFLGKKLLPQCENKVGGFRCNRRTKNLIPFGGKYVCSSCYTKLAGHPYKPKKVKIKESKVIKPTHIADLVALNQIGVEDNLRHSFRENAMKAIGRVNKSRIASNPYTNYSYKTSSAKVNNEYQNSMKLVKKRRELAVSEHAKTINDDESLPF